jgi:hypothetical protein
MSDTVGSNSSDVAPGSPAAEVTVGPPEKISLDDIRHKALRIREDVRQEARDLVADRTAQLITGAIVGVLALVSLAFFFGTRVGRRSVTPL